MLCWPSQVRYLVARRLHVEAEQQDVAVLHGVVLALHPHLPGLLRPLLAAQRHVVLVGDALRGDEAALEVAVDRARRLRRPRAPRDGPGTRLQRSEEHTSELQSRQYLVCRLLLEKKTKSP